MVSTARTVENVEREVWEAAEAFASSHDTNLGTVVTEALTRYLEDESDRDAAQRSRTEGGKIPYDLGRRLLLAESDEEAALIEEEIAAYDATDHR